MHEGVWSEMRVLCIKKHEKYLDHQLFLLSCLEFHSSNVKLLLMLRLQREQMGTRFSKTVLPPFDSGTLCPHWKSKRVIVFLHQDVIHFDSNSFPTSLNHNCSRTAFGIFAFLYRLAILHEYSLWRLNDFEIVYPDVRNSRLNGRTR